MKKKARQLLKEIQSGKRDNININKDGIELDEEGNVIEDINPNADELAVTELELEDEITIAEEDEEEEEEQITMVEKEEEVEEQPIIAPPVKEVKFKKLPVKQSNAISQLKRRHKPILQGNKKGIELNVLNVEPLKFGAIKDEKGFISTRMEVLEEKLGIATLPIEIANILPQVKELARHDMMPFRGSVLITGTTRKCRSSLLDQYVRDIENSVSRGEIYDESIVDEIIIEGQTYEYLTLNQYELNMLNTLMLNINFVCYIDENDDYRINVGGDYV